MRCSTPRQRFVAGPHRTASWSTFTTTAPAHPDPLAGLIPPPASSAADAELGLWLTHQLDIDVALIYGDDGFTVRLRGGTITG